MVTVAVTLMTFYIYIYTYYIYIYNYVYIYNSIYITYRIQPVETMIHWWLCALLAGIGHTVKITMFALEKSKRFTCQEISARKVEKFEKIEKSKSSKKSKNSKSRKLFGFMTF